MQVSGWKKKVENDLSPEYEVPFRIQVFSPINSSKVVFQAKRLRKIFCPEDKLDCDVTSLKRWDHLPAGMSDMKVVISLDDDYLQTAKKTFMGFKFEVRAGTLQSPGNSRFIAELLCIKSVLLLVSIYCCWVLWSAMKRHAASQKDAHAVMIRRQLVFQILVNDPLAIVLLYSPSNIGYAFTNLCEALYYSHLVFYWLTCFKVVSSDQTFHDPESAQTDSLAKQLVRKALAIFVALFSDYLVESMSIGYAPADPSSYPLHSNAQTFERCLQCLIAVVVCLLGYHGFCAIRSWSTVRPSHKMWYQTTAYFATVIGLCSLG